MKYLRTKMTHPQLNLRTSSDKMSFNLSAQGRTHLGQAGVRGTMQITRGAEIGIRDNPTEGAASECFLPAENALKWSLYLNFPFSFRKCSGLNFSGSGNSCLSYKTESSVGIMTVPWREHRPPWSVRLTYHRLSSGGPQLNFTLDKWYISNWRSFLPKGR